MSLIHIEPCDPRADCYVLRLYQQGGSYEATSRYQASATVEIVGSRARVKGFSGKLTRAHYEAFLDKLRDMAVLRVEWQCRNGRDRSIEL